MSRSPRPRSQGQGRIPMSEVGDATRPSPFRDSPRDDDDDDETYERSRMLPKAEFLANRLPAQSSRRTRLLGIASGLAVLIIMALFITYHTSRGDDSEYAETSLPTRVIPTEDTQFSGLATGWVPLPTAPSETSEEAYFPLPTGDIRKGIVIASYKSQKVDWIQNLSKYTKGWEIYRYIADDPATDFLPVPNPNGREAMAFLTYIIDNYDKLPDVSVFTHGHDRTWHQVEHIIDKLMALNLTALARESYINLRCSESPGCTKDTKFYFKPRNKQDTRPGTQIEEGFWKHMMEDHFGELPPVFGRRCCAQFAVTRSAIQLRSHEFWRNLRLPLEGSIEDIKRIWGPNVNQYSLGSLYEQIWHILFGKPADYCPSREVCQKVHFSDVIHCNGETTSFKENKNNWQQISCTNELRNLVDSGVPLDDVIAKGTDAAVPTPTPTLDDGMKS